MSVCIMTICTLHTFSTKDNVLSIGVASSSSTPFTTAERKMRYFVGCKISDGRIPFLYIEDASPDWLVQKTVQIGMELFDFPKDIRIINVRVFKVDPNDVNVATKLESTLSDNSKLVGFHHELKSLHPQGEGDVYLFLHPVQLTRKS